MDEILGGGLPRGRLYLVRGAPGVGKTTLGLQFLLHGVRERERALYITFSETREQIERTARSHEWSPAGLELHVVTPARAADMHQTIFDPVDVELTETMAALHDAVEHACADRVVVDSLAELRLLAADPLLYRRHVSALRALFADQHATAVLLGEGPSDQAPIEALADGVLALGRPTAGFGGARRWVQVEKMRGVPFQDGRHDAAIATGGWVVYPRQGATGARRPAPPAPASSGIPDLDGLTGGGLDRGSSALLVGPTGVGKSSVATQYVVAAASRGEGAALFLFHEAPELLARRSDAIGMRFSERAAAGHIHVFSVEPSWSLGQFGFRVREAVERHGADVVVIDGVAEYLELAPNRRLGIAHLRTLLGYLRDRGAVVLLVGTPQVEQVGTLTDAVFLFRRYEHAGAIGQTLAIVKRRAGDHARTVHDLRLGKPEGINVGPAQSHDAPGTPARAGTSIPDVEP